MTHRLRRHLSFANVTSAAALFVALGGVGYAATQLPKHSVGTKQLKKNAVTGAKVRNGSLAAGDFKPSALARLRGPQGSAGPPGGAGPQGGAGPPGNAGAGARGARRPTSRVPARGDRSGRCRSARLVGLR